MKKKKKETPRARLKKLMIELNYQRQMLLVDIRAVMAGRAKIFELGAKMRKIQKEIQRAKNKKTRHKK